MTSKAPHDEVEPANLGDDLDQLIDELSKADSPLRSRVDAALEQRVLDRKLAAQRDRDRAD